MSALVCVVVAIASVPGALWAGDGDGDEASGPARRVVAYFVSWGVYARDYHVPDIPADKITHLNFAFANVVDGECVVGDTWADTELPYAGDTFDQPLAGSFHQLALLKEDYPDLKTLIAVGGWTWSGDFSDAVSTDLDRELFAGSCVDFMLEYGFDGVDLDWEYPVSGGLGSNGASEDDKENFTLFLEELRAQLDDAEEENDAEYLLTIASAAGPDLIENYELELIHEYLDWINVMTYDFHGGWSDVTNLQAPLYLPDDGPDGFEGWDTDAAVQTYLDAGVPADKLQIGVPFYARGWAGVPDIDDGIFQEWDFLPVGTWESGVFDYQDLVENYIDDGYDRHWHDGARAPWLYNPDTEIMISYEDTESLEEKLAYIADNDLGGIMLWELSADDDDETLLTTIWDAFTSEGEGEDDEPRFLRGDADGNGEVSAIPDALFLLRWGFQDGADPPCADAADCDDSGAVAPIPDALTVLYWGFSTGPDLPDPGTSECGVDPVPDGATPDDLDCAEVAKACQ